jgi:hypothetical protein
VYLMSLGVRVERGKTDSRQRCDYMITVIG